MDYSYVGLILIVIGLFYYVGPWLYKQMSKNKLPKSGILTDEFKDGLEVLFLVIGSLLGTCIVIYWLLEAIAGLFNRL